MLSVVVIGKDEADNLPRLIRSIEKLIIACDFPVESIYVDSGSTDGSVEIATSGFDRAIELSDSDQLCASSGRYVGTIASRYPWILYLDGDMEICPQFFEVVRALPAGTEDCAGFVGYYVHNFDNGSVAFQGFGGGIVKSEWAAQFGGAVLLKRAAVLRVGNWDPGIYGKEEMELYARLGDGKRVVRYVNVPMINHYSEYLTRVELLKRLIYPGGGQGKVFYGFGQSIRALMIRGKLTAMIRLDFEPFLFLSLLLLSLLIALMMPLEWGFLLVASTALALSVWMSPGPAIRYLMLPIPFVLGITKYIPYFRPEIRLWAWTSENNG